MWEDAGVTAVEAAGSADTRERILEIGEELAQTRGYNGFSYADISRRLALTTASLHYHFPRKQRLGLALVERYGARFAAALDAITASGLAPRAELEAYAGLYREVLAQDRMCLCGILAAERETLPAGMRSALDRFFQANESWLATVLARAEAEGSLAPGRGTTAVLPGLIVAALEGAMLVAHGTGEIARFDTAVRGLLALVVT
jgi:TetR/AcrR family transcriptional repressor of nem operon